MKTTRLSGISRASFRYSPQTKPSSSTPSHERITRAGTYRLTVRDATRGENFHLLGAGVNKKTGVRFKGSVIWTVTFRAGSYTLRSDASKKLRRNFKVI